jgi:hypothetical protein
MFALSVGLTILAGPAPVAANEAEDKKEILSVWNRYQDLIVIRKGTEAVKLLAAPTIKYYADVRQAILTGTRKEVASKGILTRLTIYMLRHLMTAPQLTAMTPRTFLAWTIDQGMTAASGKRRVPLTKITIDKDRATGHIGQGTPATTPSFRFFRESGAWKLDYAQIVKKFEPLMEARMKKGGITDEQVVKIMVKRFSKKPINMEKLREPLVKAK